MPQPCPDGAFIYTKIKRYFDDGFLFCQYILIMKKEGEWEEIEQFNGARKLKKRPQPKN